MLREATKDTRAHTHAQINSAVFTSLVINLAIITQNVDQLYVNVYIICGMVVDKT